MNFDFEYYTGDSIILKRLPTNKKNEDYVLIGCDIPTKEDSQLRFWKEIGYRDGTACNSGVILSQKEINQVKKYLIQETMQDNFTILHPCAYIPNDWLDNDKKRG